MQQFNDTAQQFKDKGPKRGIHKVMVLKHGQWKVYAVTKKGFGTVRLFAEKAVIGIIPARGPRLDVIGRVVD